MHNLASSRFLPLVLLTLLSTLTAPGCDSRGSAPSDPPADPECAAGQADCDRDGACETDITDPSNCGGCGHVCLAGPHSSATCTTGNCGLACDAGWYDCDLDAKNGCESDLTTPAACGMCGNSCGGACVAGKCATCDDGLEVASTDPLDAVKALGLCDGVVSARWVLPDGSPPPSTVAFHLGHGILPGFGSAVSPREGARLVAISSGAARPPGTPGHSDVDVDKGYSMEFNVEVPNPAPSCPNDPQGGGVFDAIALELVLKVPDWAKGFAFDFDFYTKEWPAFVCSDYNDYFLALLSPPPSGQTHGNVSYDSAGNFVSVNAAFVSVCGCSEGPPCFAGGRAFTCPAGTASR